MSRRFPRWLCLLLLAACSPGEPPLFDGAEPVALSSLVAGQPLSDADRDRLVARVVEVHGGPEALATLCFEQDGDRHLRVEITTAKQGAARLWYRHDENLRLNVKLTEGTEQRILQNGDAYMAHQLLPTPAFAKGDLDQNVWWAYQAAYPARLLADPDAEIRSLEPREIDGRLCARLSVLVWHLPEVEMTIDPRGPAILRIDADLPFLVQAQSTKTSIRMREDHEDFRRVDGVLFPMRRRLYNDDKVIGLFDAFECRVVDGIDDAVFAPK